MSSSQLIQANIHRVKEGARVVEDIARFILKDAYLFKKIRTLRHSLTESHRSFFLDEDLGGPIFKEANVRVNLLERVQANIIRIQEGLRVIEEFSLSKFYKDKIKSLRYISYDLQHELIKKTIIFLNHNKLCGLYLIIDLDLLTISLENAITIINKSAIKIVQLRSKRLSKREFLTKTIQCKRLLKPDTLLIINDHVDIALDLADGVHVGQQDYPIERVRQMSPDHFVIGVSCHNNDEAEKAESLGASYIAVGCLFSTNTKRDVTRTSLTELKKIKQNVSLPICAIGGINEGNISILLPYKVEMIAMISAIWNAKCPHDIISSVEQLIMKSIELGLSKETFNKSGKIEK